MPFVKLDPKRILDPRGQVDRLTGEVLKYYTPTELAEVVAGKNENYDDDVLAVDPFHARDSIAIVIRCLHIQRHRGMSVNADLQAAHVRARAVGPAADGHHSDVTNVTPP